MMPRMRSRFWPVIGLVLILAAIACAAPSYAPTTTSCPDCPLIPVDRVIDGETLDSAGDTVRLYGVNAPDRGYGCYQEATARLRELAGDSVRLELGPRKKDSSGRVLAYVHTEAGDSVDAALVREGLAVPWVWDGRHRDALVALGREAQEQGAGCLYG
jgi:endonuclease YncB( thermonuclease family)